ncbi:hypothetical protein BBEV_0316 [Salisediminibacterium beveridgei]|uniref:Uncharacterized protein n=1 Tax=Salisediminibacterium beveridgei TaxID=632773 RepID=A0A1D7QRT0_9BACI|nr:hypothetical protein BBEV_0316 [Salisediminibacterium beveridgei]
MFLVLSTYGKNLDFRVPIGYATLTFYLVFMWNYETDFVYAAAGGSILGLLVFLFAYKVAIPYHGIPLAVTIMAAMPFIYHIRTTDDRLLSTEGFSEQVLTLEKVTEVMQQPVILAVPLSAVVMNLVIYWGYGYFSRKKTRLE